MGPISTDGDPHPRPWPNSIAGVRVLSLPRSPDGLAPWQCPGAPAEGSDDPQTDQLRSTCVSTWSPPGTQRGWAQGLSQEDAWTVESRIQCPPSKSSPQPERVTLATPWGKASTPYPCSSLRLRSQPASLSLSLALSSSPSRFPSGFPEVPKSPGLGDPTWVLPPPCPPGLRLSGSTRRSAPHLPTPRTAAHPPHPPCPTCPSHHQHPFTRHQVSLLLPPAGSADERGHSQAWVPSPAHQLVVPDVHRLSRLLFCRRDSLLLLNFTNFHLLNICSVP